jgi:hypothetical protein
MSNQVSPAPIARAGFAGRRYHGQSRGGFVRGKIIELRAEFISVSGMAGTILEALQPLLATPEPPELGPGPRRGVKPERGLSGELNELFHRFPLPQTSQQLIRALVLLWHDHLDASHTISQGIETPDGAFAHGIMHRREPDYANAKYWFRRVGAHPCFPEIATRATALLRSEPALLNALIKDGEWDAFAFVDACERAARHPGARERALREVQRIETAVLLEHCAGQ